MFQGTRRRATIVGSQEGLNWSLQDFGGDGACKVLERFPS